MIVQVRAWLKQTTLVVAALLALALTTTGGASADPINANTTSFTATCTGLGEVTVVAIFFASGNANAGGATSAFQVVGSNTVLIAFTPGTDRQAEEDDTTCTVTAINGQPIEPVTVLVKIVPTLNTVAFFSGQDWETFAEDPGSGIADGRPSGLGPAQLVCMNAYAPYPCPQGATVYGAPFSGWSADLGPISGASWIWAPGVNGMTAGAELADYWFIKDLMLSSQPTAGVVYLAADDYAEVSVNGVVAGSVGSVVDPALAGAHTYLTAFDVASLLRPGRNVIAVRAQNGPTWYSPYCSETCTYAQNPAGVVFGGWLSWLNPNAP